MEANKDNRHVTGATELSEVKLLMNNADPDLCRSKEDTRRLVHELEIKLKMQDAALVSAREELEFSGNKYAEDIVNTVREPLVVLNSHLKILTANCSFYGTFKVTPEDTVGNFIYDLGNRQWDIPKLRVLFEEILPHETVITDYEVEHDFPNIGLRVILLNAREIFRGNIGEHVILLAMEDITERRQAADALIAKGQELQELNSSLEVRIDTAVDELRQKDQLLIQKYRQALMGEMITNIAHQWRQPLNNLGLVIQQMPLYFEAGEFNKEFMEETTEKSMELILSMSRIIDDFRTFFRTDQEEATFGVKQVIERTVSLIEKSFEDQKIGIVIHTEGDPVITGYPNEFAQVLLNILMNARDALVIDEVSDALISINGFWEGELAVVTITDNAAGIADKIINKLFNPYFTTKGPDKGTGIGLFMSKTIIEKNMGGRLTVRNTGSGAEFRIEV